MIEVSRPVGLVTITFEDFLNDDGSPILLTKQLLDIIGQTSREQFGKITEFHLSFLIISICIVFS